ncbi:hypothetical protein GCM10009546_01650 [Actinomadura livida]|uniref:Ferredoxin n=1 Tax=Actinomadura livida TaxID=79909 RepID=A0ABP3NF92_9ACTN|nr:hypothetical protein GCM10010208_27890 [Actinomadura livida]
MPSELPNRRCAGCMPPSLLGMPDNADVHVVEVSLDELVAQARACPALATERSLAEWIGPGRKVTTRGGACSRPRPSRRVNCWAWRRRPASRAARWTSPN